MNFSKYTDMVYMNHRGSAWLSTLYSPQMWSRWVNRVKRSMQGTKVSSSPETYAQRIVVEALWHLGYAKDTTSARAMSRCARRLRQPPERGAGVDKRGAYADAMDIESKALPMEFIMLDEFLENIVRPTL